MRVPRQITYGLFPVCRAGQHENCQAVTDPFDEERDTRDIEACDCDCHYATADARALAQTPEREGRGRA